MEGRRSFPSGHSSTAFSGMVYLSLWLAGMTGAWCFSHPAPAKSFFGSRTARLSLTLLPIAFATWVAVSRIEDYVCDPIYLICADCSYCAQRHHKEDVIVGGLIGTLTATTSYFIYWPSPFLFRGADLDRGAVRPRNIYRDEEPSTTRNDYDYELAGLDHGGEAV